MESLIRGCGEEEKRLKSNKQRQAAVFFAAALLFLAVVTAAGVLCREAALETDFSRKNLAPCREYWFGTDWMGRDMFARTLAGLSMSIRIGLCTAGVSACLALLLGVAAAVMGKAADRMISFLIDTIMGIPHLLLLILISYALGKGFLGVAAGVALTHWPSLTRVIRGEVLQLKNSEFYQISRKLGWGRGQAAARHMLPHLVPQFTVGLILMFPHAILHESSITFLGFGLSAKQPAIGVILSESMRYLITGQWWLALFPGLMLVITVLLFDRAGNALRCLLEPMESREGFYG